MSITLRRQALALTVAFGLLSGCAGRTAGVVWGSLAVLSVSGAVYVGATAPACRPDQLLCNTDDVILLGVLGGVVFGIASGVAFSRDPAAQRRAHQEEEARAISYAAQHEQERQDRAVDDEHRPHVPALSTDATTTQLARQARQHAGAHDCDIVELLAEKVRVRDVVYYRALLASGALSGCDATLREQDRVQQLAERRQRDLDEQGAIDAAAAKQAAEQRARDEEVRTALPAVATDETTLRLARQARAAARDHHCEAVHQLKPQIQQRDPAYYKALIASAALSGC